MASLAMTSPFLGSAMNLIKLPSSATATSRRSTVMVKASKVTDIKGSAPEEKSSKRRDLVFAAAAAAVCSVARVAMADEPKPGTAEAKKKYGPVCVSMPTARICRN